MDKTLEIIKEYWVFLSALVGFVAWLIRVEAKAVKNADDIRRVEGKTDSALIRIEQRMKDDKAETADMLREIRGDIKHMLSNMGK